MSISSLAANLFCLFNPFNPLRSQMAKNCRNACHMYRNVRAHVRVRVHKSTISGSSEWTARLWYAQKPLVVCPGTSPAAKSGEKGVCLSVCVCVCVRLCENYLTVLGFVNRICRRNVLSGRGPERRGGGSEISPLGIFLRDWLQLATC